MLAVSVQWRIKDFPGGAQPPKLDYFANFLPKLHENERIWTPGGVPDAPLDPPMQFCCLVQITFQGPIVFQNCENLNRCGMPTWPDRHQHRVCHIHDVTGGDGILEIGSVF